jgi:hypothetical protein
MLPHVYNNKEVVLPTARVTDAQMKDKYREFII